MSTVNTGFDPISSVPADPQMRLRYAAQQLEALWLKHVLKEGRGSGGGMLDNSLASRTFHDMLDEALADCMAEGGALGLADRIIEQMQPAPIAESARANSQSLLQQGKHP